MVLYPDTQKRAQEEIDSILGHGHFPQIGDVDWWNLSYPGSCTAHLVQYHFPGVRLETAPHPIFGARRGLRAHLLYKPSYSCLAPILSLSPIPSLSRVSVRYFTIQPTHARPSQMDS